MKHHLEVISDLSVLFADDDAEFGKRVRALLAVELQRKFWVDRVMEHHPTRCPGRYHTTMLIYKPSTQWNPTMLMTLTVDNLQSLYRSVKYIPNETNTESNTT